MTEYQEAGSSTGWMQQLETNVGRRLLDDMLEPAAGVMRMSVDDDDQADQQHERVYSHTFVLFRLLYSSLFAAMVAQH